MATELHLSHSPMPRIKRQIRELQSNDDSHVNLLHEVIESNIRTQQAVSDVSKNLNEFVNLLKSVSETEDKIESAVVSPKQGISRPAAVPAQALSTVEQKLDKIASQNLQLIQLISELVKHLKEKGSSAPSNQRTYQGTSPLRPYQ